MVNHDVLYAAAAVVLLIIIYIVVANKKKDKKKDDGGKTPAPSSKPPTTLAGMKPPAGSPLFVEGDGSKIPYTPGQKWPDPSYCPQGYKYGLISYACKGKEPTLINGGGIKCTNSGNNSWYPCSQAKSALP